MAKKSAIARNKKRIRMVEKYSEIRNELKDIANFSINYIILFFNYTVI